MGKLKDNLDQIGFNFKGLDKTTIDLKNAQIRKEKRIKKEMSQIETIVKLYNPPEEEKVKLRENWKMLKGELDASI